MKHLSTCSILGGFLVILSALEASAAIPASERSALLDMYQSTNGEHWRDSSGWGGAAGSECSWFGVTCNGDGSRVIGLALADNQLVGSIPSSIWDLTRLTNLDLSVNHLSGTIPWQIAFLSYIEFLDISANQLVGPLPDEMLVLVTLADNGSNFRFNALFTENTELESFLTAKQQSGGWTSLQTVAPSDVQVVGLSGVSASLEWTRENYQEQAGGVEIFVRRSGDESSQRVARIGSKYVDQWRVFELEPGQTYDVTLKAFSLPGEDNPNLVVSGESEPVHIETTNDPSTLYVDSSGNLSNDCLSQGAPCPTISAALSKSADGQQVVVAAGIYHESVSISKAIHLRGAGPGVTILDGTNQGLNVVGISGYPVKLSGLTVRNGSNQLSRAGGVHCWGGVQMEDCEIINNSTNENGGALMTSYHPVYLRNVRIVGNHADDWGGGVYSDMAPLVFESCTIDQNTAHLGAGIYAAGEWPSNVIVDSTTVSANVATYRGGGIATDDEFTTYLVNSTISGNTAEFAYGGGIDVNWGDLILDACTIADNTGGTNDGSGVRADGLVGMSSIIAGNSPVNCDVWASSVDSWGRNLEDAATCALGSGHGDLVNTDPFLAPLADNGGPTMTHSLASNSPAVDAGHPVLIGVLDQRGLLRGADGDLDGVNDSDIGAFELFGGRLFSDGFESADTSRWSGAMP